MIKEGDVITIGHKYSKDRSYGKVVGCRAKVMRVKKAIRTHGSEPSPCTVCYVEILDETILAWNHWWINLEDAHLPYQVNKDAVRLLKR
jgi:hypothetical protein